MFRPLCLNRFPQALLWPSRNNLSYIMRQPLSWPADALIMLKSYPVTSYIPSYLFVANSSMSFFRLAMKLAASGRYDLALVQMNEALQANRWNKLYYWGSALLTLMVKIPHILGWYRIGLPTVINCFEKIIYNPNTFWWWRVKIMDTYRSLGTIIVS